MADVPDHPCETPPEKQATGWTCPVCGQRWFYTVGGAEVTDLDDPSLSHARPRATTRCPHTAAELRAARMAVARASRARYPQDGDPRAVGDLAGLLAMLGLDQS